MEVKIPEIGDVVIYGKYIGVMVAERTMKTKDGRMHFIKNINKVGLITSAYAYAYLIYERYIRGNV